jgi:hypothetical protein
VKAELKAEMQEWIAAWCVVARVAALPPQDEAALLTRLSSLAFQDVHRHGADSAWLADAEFVGLLTDHVRTLRGTWEAGVEAEPDVCGATCDVPDSVYKGGTTAVCGYGRGHAGQHYDEEINLDWPQ